MCENKKCTKCQETKPLSEFGKSNRTKDGKQNQCKTCRKIQADINRQNRPPNIKPEYGFKKCSKCCIEKHVNDFYLNPNLSMGVHSECISCTKNKVSKWQKDNPEKIKNRIRKPILPKPKKEKVKPTKKECKYCKETFSIEEFPKSGSRCKLCLKTYTQGRSCTVEITEKKCGKCKEIKPSSCFHKASNTVSGLSSKCNTCRKKDYEKRKENILFNKKIKHSLKYKTDPFYRLVYTIRGRIRNSLTIYLKDTKKSKHSEEILGCTWEEFKTHIESQFFNWMTWDNFGDVCGDSPDYNCSWDLDHIIPVSWAQTNEELYSLNHWSNFQPLCSKVNRWDKSGKVYPLCNRELNLTVYS